MKSSHPNYTLPGARLKSFASLDNIFLLIYSKQPMSTYHTQCQNIGRMEEHADTDLQIKANDCERRSGHLSHRQ